MNLILAAATAGLVLATLFALAARLWWVFDLFSHFRLQYVIVAASVGLLALATGAWPTAAVLAVVALVHGFAIRALWLGVPPAVADGMPLRILTINVLADNRTPEAVFQFVRASDADLVVLVDAKRWRWRQVVADLGRPYPYQVPRSWPEAPPVFLFSRFPIVTEDVMREDGVRPRGRQPYLAVELAVGGQTLVLAGVHSSMAASGAPGYRRRRELVRIAEIVTRTDRPVIVAGDFNTTPWSPHLRDLVRTAGLRNAADGQGYVASWPRWLRPARIPIDHVLLKGPWVVTSLRRGPALGSDHYPIIADLRLLSSV